MKRHVFILALGASLALLGSQAANARGTGGAHPSQPHSGGSKQGEARPGGAQPGNANRNEPQSNQSRGNQSFGNQSHANQSFGNQSHGNQSHANQPQLASHGSNFSLPTDAGFGHSSQGKSATGFAGGQQKQPQYSGAQGAAAGAAATNRNAPQYSGAQGAAAANRNDPKYSGAQGAAAGAAAANRNDPKYSGAQGAAAGAAVANRNAPQYSGAQGAAAGYAAAGHRTTAVPGSVNVARGAAVRTTYNGSGMYGAAWHTANPGAWAPTGWTAGRVWGAATWPAVGAVLGWSAVQPIPYNYGTNITYQGDQVYSDNQPVATADEYYQQASTLAQSAPAPDPAAADWTPLGVFALVQNDQADPHYVMQLAVNKAGTLGGNYTDLISGANHTIQGAVDQKTQRVAWTVGSNKNTVGETGLYNLTQNEAPALIHIGKDKTQQWLLVRLQQPDAPKSE